LPGQKKKRDSRFRGNDEMTFIDHSWIFLSPSDALQTLAMPDSRPLLFFDSGIGGLSVLAPTRALLPNAPLVYAADNGGFPYGIRAEAEIAARVPALLGRMVERYRPRLIVIACNTASTIALAAVRAALDLPIVGTVPAIKPAAALSKTRAIAVLGTDATVRQPYVDNLSAEFASDCLVLRHGSARLVELAEAKLRGEPADLSEYRAIWEALLDQPGGDQVDTVVLACTHFPLVADELRAAAPRPLTFVDGGDGISRRVAWLTQGQTWPDSPGEGVVLFTKRFDPVPELINRLALYGLGRVAYL
jgi:glutamate racemase